MNKYCNQLKSLHLLGEVLCDRRSYKWNYLQDNINNPNCKPTNLQELCLHNILGTNILEKCSNIQVKRLNIVFSGWNFDAEDWPGSDLKLKNFIKHQFSFNGNQKLEMLQLTYYHYHHRIDNFADGTHESDYNVGHNIFQILTESFNRCIYKPFHLKILIMEESYKVYDTIACDCRINFDQFTKFIHQFMKYFKYGILELVVESDQPESMMDYYFHRFNDSGICDYMECELKGKKISSVAVRYSWKVYSNNVKRKIKNNQFSWFSNCKYTC